jgi:23S rRNA (cytosine1962-C5)-methyltransferase
MLRPPMTMKGPPRVRLKKALERSLHKGHPWIYADALSAPAGLETGAEVAVVGRDGRPIARGLYDARSPIAVRVAWLDPKEALDGVFVRARLKAALACRRGAIDASTTDAFRWCNGEGDFLPGVVVDVYRQVAVLRLDGDAVRVWRDAVVAAILELGRGLGIDCVYERSRGGAGQALHGPPPTGPVEIREHGARFAVDVVHGQKTGFFLDQRENRLALRPYARGLLVANLFGYTGGFSVAAALGGAKRVVTVDSAAPALKDAEINFALNGLDPGAHELACADAFDWLKAAAAARRAFGLVVVDPPSFAPSEQSVGRALAAYRDVNALALKIVEPGGLLAAASCSSHVGMEAFLEALTDAGERARRPLRVLEVRGQPADHPTLPVFTEGRYLKFVLVRAD